MADAKARPRMTGILLAASLVYLLLPILLFFLGFLKIWIALPLAALFSAFGVRFWRSLQKGTADAFALQPWPSAKGGGPCRLHKVMHAPMVFLLIAFSALALWVVLSGIGGFSYQNSDFFARNPVYRDLIDYPWPVYYDLSKEPAAVRQITGSGTVAFAYYFAWWLPPAALSKLFHFTEAGRELALFLWAVFGVLLCFACLTMLFRRFSYRALFLFIAFGGMDILMFKKTYGFFRFTEHMEWWANYFQYSSQTTQLYWVFNQVLPVWLLMALFLLSSDNEQTAGLLALSFAFSPWATIGLLPFGLASFLCGRRKRALNLTNILVPLSMLLVFGSFYLASGGSSGSAGLVFALYPDASAKEILLRYLLFVLIEFGAYVLVAGPALLKMRYALIAVLTLLALPFLYIRDFNFTMRASVPALFLLMVCLVKALSEKSIGLPRRAVLIALLIIGMGGSLSEIGRSLQKRAELPKEEWRREQIYSLGQMRTEDPYYIGLMREQFFVEAPEESFFFRRLAK